jgi:hypothetical protein
MKTKHNKKRNTAFLFEALTTELTKSFISQDKKRTDTIKKIIKEHFTKKNALGKELDCYQSLIKEETLDSYTAEKLIHQTRVEYESLNKKQIFQEQSKVIKKINHFLGKEVYNNFVPNYKNYATLSQIFGGNLPVRTRVLMEKKIIDSLVAEEQEKDLMKPVDSLVVNSFVKNFNTKYKNLLPEQREILERYITSFGADEPEFRLSLAKNLRSLQEKVRTSLNMPEISEDELMIENTKKVLEIISNIDPSRMSESELLKVLKIQKLVSEYHNDDD